MQVLVVDDQGAVRTALQLLFELEGLECLTASSPAEALDLVRNHDVGVVVQDMNFSKDTTSGDEGVALFRQLRALDSDLPVILLTAWTSLQTAVSMIKEGAADYLAKPWDDPKLLQSVRNLLELHGARRTALRQRAHDRRAKEELAQRFDLRGLIYQSRAMHEAVSLAVHVAPSDAAVLITGPNGCGKERIAQIIQANSRRKDAPFVQVNAGGLPDQLLEAELFGAEAGAFTGATKLRIGRFEAAHGGTLFLDELGNLSLAGQMKLLRVLQTGEYQRLGSNTTRKADVRLISATNADLKAEIAAGRFREDLLFRLNVIEVALPALAQRAEDVPGLAEHFLKQHTAAPGSQGQTPPKRFAADAMQALLHYDWPGNVRELENRIQRAALVNTTDTIQRQDLGLPADGTQHAVRPAATAPSPEPTTWTDRAPLGALAEAERAAVEHALSSANGVVARAAAELGMSRQALYRRMDRLGISVERLIR